MKIYKYVTVLLALVAMSATFVGCDRDGDITGNPMADHTQGAKQDYWIAFELSNAGSLSQAAQSLFDEKIVEVIYNEDYLAGTRNIKFIEHPIYETESYVLANFNAVAAIPNEESDIVQKIMIPTFCVDTVGGVNHNDFVVTMTLSKDSMRTVLATHSWNASTAFDGQALINANKNK